MNDIVNKGFDRYGEAKIYSFGKVKYMDMSNLDITKNNITRGYGLLEIFLAKKRARMADKLIPQNLRSGRILDIGCGTIPFFLINTKFKGKYGIDPSVKAFGPKEDIILKRFDIERNAKFPFKDNFFDVVTMLAVFEHIEPDKLVGILREIRRVLKPSGRFILTTPCPWTDRLLRFIAKLRLVSSKEMEEHKGAYNQVSIASYLDKAGFEKKKVNLGYFEIFLNNWVYADK